MIAPNEIRQQAEKWWSRVLRDALAVSDVRFFPHFVNKIGKVKASTRLQEFERIRAEHQRLLAESKSRTGSGYTLHWVERDFRDIGRNRIIERISIDTREDYLALTRKQRAFNAFCQDVALVRAEVPELEKWMQAQPLRVVKASGSWPDLLRVVRYFLDTPDLSAYYLRELPLPVPTKFIESNAVLLARMLDAVLPAARIFSNHATTSATGFARRYGLRYPVARVRVRVLDAHLADQYFAGVSDLELPADQFAALRLPVQRVFVLENKASFSNLMNFLTLPQLAGTLGIFGRGFGVGALRKVRWLDAVPIYYWGDIDAQGLRILSRLRDHFSDVRPFLMDEEVLTRFAQYVVSGTPDPGNIPPNLTEVEASLYAKLNRAVIRLEQEHIPHVYVRKVVAGLK